MAVTVAQLTSGQGLTVKGEVIEGASRTELTPEGNLNTQELIESTTFSITSSGVQTTELIENPNI